MNCDHAGPWAAHPSTHTDASYQWRRQDFVTGGSEVWVYRGSRVRSLPIPLVLSVYRRGSLLDGLAMYLSCDTKKFHDNESTHILHNFWTSTHGGKLPPPYPLAAPLVRSVRVSGWVGGPGPGMIAVHLSAMSLIVAWCVLGDVERV